MKAPKRPRDTNQLAKMVVDVVTNERSEGIQQTTECPPRHTAKKKKPDSEKAKKD